MENDLIKYDPSLFEIEGTVLKKYKGEREYVEIPEGVTEIGEEAFAHLYHVEEVRIPETVTKIGTLAFVHCHKLKDIIIPKNVTEIGDSAFYRCYYLKRVTIYGQVTKIGKETFECCSSLATVTLPNSLQEIGSTAFCLCPKLKSIQLPSGLTTIKEKAFLRSGLTMVFIPSTVITIEKEAFGFCDDLAHIACEAKKQPEGWSEYWINYPMWRKKEKALFGCKRKK